MLQFTEIKIPETVLFESNCAHAQYGCGHFWFNGARLFTVRYTTILRRESNVEPRPVFKGAQVFWVALSADDLNMSKMFAVTRNLAVNLRKVRCFRLRVEPEAMSSANLRKLHAPICVFAVVWCM